MPKFDWQLIVVILALIGAGLYLVRRTMQTFRTSRRRSPGASSCGSCGSCDTGKTVSGESTTGFVPLEDLMSSKPRSSR